MSSTTRMRFQAGIVALAPAVLFAGFFYHPHIHVLTDSAAIAEALLADPTRWGIAHLMIGVGSALLAVAFLALRSLLRDAGEERWSPVALPFVVMGSVLFAMLPAMEMGPLVAAGIGADVQAAQIALDAWFLPVLLAGALIFAIGAIGFAMGFAQSRVLGPGTTWLVAPALVIMAAVRFLPFGAALHIGGVTVILAFWPVARAIWKSSEAHAADAGRARGRMAEAY